MDNGTRGKPVRIVVDTDVVRAAGEGPAEEARRAADVLSAIDKGGFVLAISKELRDEWLRRRTEKPSSASNYVSAYSWVWWTKMRERGREVEVKIDDRLGDPIISAVPPGHTAKRRALRKDLPVILTALAADHRLISNNRRERQTLAGTCENSEAGKILAKLLWPLTLQAACIWLRSGAKDTVEHRVCQGN